VEPAVRMATLSGYADLARSLHLDPAELMAAVGLEVADLEVPDRWVSGVQAARLLELSSERSGREDFAFRLAQHRALGTLGPLSVILRDEPDLRSALHLLTRYDDLYTGVLDLELEEGVRLATLKIWLHFGEPVPTDQSLDLTAAATLGIIRHLLGTEWTPLATYFAHPKPADPGPAHRLFGPKVVFDHGFTGMTFRVHDLDLPVAMSDASVRPYSRQFLGTVIAQRARSASDQTAEVIEVMLPLGNRSIESVSSHLGISPRVLRQRLALEGTSFSSVVHATRRSLAERYLGIDHFSLTEISQLLGFAAPSAFSRWFHQQFGTTPSAWRRRAHDAATDDVPQG
jgi:AraC-like DNA-binding protein